MKIRLPKTRRFRIYIYIASLLLILFAIDLILIRIGRYITVAYDTTRITSPLKPDGTPDYVGVLDASYSAGITTENNAAPLLLAAVGPEALFQPHLSAVYARLSMPPLPKDGDYFIPYSKFLRDHAAGGKPDASLTERQVEDQLGSARRHVWRSAENSALAAWIDSQSHALALLHEAVRRPRYYAPVLTSSERPQTLDSIILDSIIFPSTGRFRALAQAAAVRAVLRAGQGDFEGARADLLAIHRLARLVAQGITPIESVVGRSIDAIAFDAHRALAFDDAFTAPQARTLIADLDSLPPHPDVAKKIDTFERYAVLDFLIRAAVLRPSTVIGQQRPDDPVTTLWGRLSLDYTPSSFNAALRNANRFLDAQVDAFIGHTFAQRHAKAMAAEKMKNDFASALGEATWRDTASLMLHYRLPSLTSLSVLTERHLMYLDLTRLALALGAYHADRHLYPETLAALAPAYLAAIPPDRFTDLPLHYQTTSGGYLLYSVGQNMTDDDAHNNLHKDKAYPRADDIVVIVGEYPATRPSPK